MKSLMLIISIFVIFFCIIFLGLITYTFITFNDVITEVDFNLTENLSFQETYNETLGVGINAVIDQADNWGIFLVFGMVIMMILCGFVFRSNQKLWLILEIFILVTAFILAGVLQYTFNETIHSSDELLDVYSNNIQKSSTFMLYLPLIIVVIWFLVIIVAYSRITPEKIQQSFSATQEVGF